MPCFRPLEGWRSPNGGPISFRLSAGMVDKPIAVPCGQCTGCRLEYSRQWAMRCVHESRMHDQNCFITLTYDDDNLPKYSSLHFAHVTLFMKRLRKYVWTYHRKRIKYYLCGEYGDETGRPHYHAIIFNYNFGDLQKWKRNERGEYLYTSKRLDALWSHGHCLVGAATFESAAYVARYIMKKQTGDMAVHYGILEYRTGRIHARVPEQSRISKGSKDSDPIGVAWYKKFKKQVHDNDFCVMRGVEVSVPRMYEKLMKEKDGRTHRKIKGQRRKAAAKHRENNTSSRHRVRERVLQSRISLLERKI